MLRLETLALALSHLNGAFNDPDGRAFQLCNPGLLKTYRPEKAVDSEHFRVFGTMMGGFKALVARLQRQCAGEDKRIPENGSLQDLLMRYLISNEAAVRKVVLFLRRALQDESITAKTEVTWFLEKSAAVQTVEN